MKTKRLTFIVLAAALMALLLISCNSKKAVQEQKVFTPSFTSDIESFRQYQYPDWFRDAKFGIWAHWGPQAVPRQGDWYYRTDQKYMTGTEVIQMLVDIVSKNCNLLLNVVQTPEGDLEQDVIDILEEIAEWTPVNGEGIYGTRPWKVYGEGPSTLKQEKGRFGGVRDVRPYGTADIRFTTKGETLYAFCMEKPTGDIRITSLGRGTGLTEKKVRSVSMPGSDNKIKWKQEEDALIIFKPDELPDWNVVTFKVEFKR